MSYQEKNITVSLTAFLFILGYYLLNVIPMYRTDSWDSTQLFVIWITVIIAGILVNIIGSILTNIVLSIVYAIRTRSDKPEPTIEDERDKLIGLKGTRNSYVVFSIGVFIAMLTFVFGNPPLVMFSLLILSGLVAEIFGDASKIFFYRRGV